MGRVPARCILLLEDLDAAFTRSLNREKKEKKRRLKAKKEAKKAKKATDAANAAGAEGLFRPVRMLRQY